LLLFLDEHTSGLDARSAWGLVRLLVETCGSVHHPPTPEFAVQSFDRLLLLGRGGETVYFG
ncbi:hypothetical protein EV363DRAFT_1136604, partial [Boletus edulis]